MHPLISYHGGHSGEFCDHGKECTLSQVFDAYVEQSFTHFGISEHQPMTEGFLYPDEIKLNRNEASLRERFDRYFSTARALQKKHAGNASIAVGFETEWYGERPEKRIQELRQLHDADFIVGSLHHVNDLPIDYSKEQYESAIASLGSLENLYCRYYDQQLELIETVAPEILGHFDLIRLFSSDFTPTPRVEKFEDRNIAAAIERGIVFDLNCAALRKNLGEPYPCCRIIEKVVAAGGSFTPGDDSHGPSDVGAKLGDGLSILKQYTDHIIVFEADENRQLQKRAQSL